MQCSFSMGYITTTIPFQNIIVTPTMQNPNNWIHSVIFEPQLKIQLTHLSYKVTSFLDFHPFINGFQSVNNYLDNLWTDIQDPYYFRYSFVPIAHINIDPTINNSHIENFLNSCACALCPYSCQAKMQFEKFKWEIHYIIKIFHATYKKFLTAIDHIDYHPSQIQNNITRTKRSVTYDIHGCYHSPTKILTPSEENFLNAFMEALYKINPSLHKNLSHMKRVSIFTWILGWGIFSNARNIAKIKDNIHALQKQNQLQDKQIKQLAHYLNLTMHQVDKHNEMLYEMDTKMTTMNKTIQHIMWNLDSMQYETNLLHFFQNKLYRVYTSLYALQLDTESLFKYMRALASQELNPMIIPPDILKNILHRIETDIKSHARLKLCEDLETNIWSYYGTIKLTPIVLEDYLMLILTVPLIDQSLHMNLYKVYNLPMLHPTLHVHAQYEIENSYLATVMDGMFITLPTALDVKLCLMMNGHLCMFKQALYLVEHTNWCIYALFINDEKQIERNCILKTINQTTNLAYSLDGYLWAISALATKKLQIRCVMETHVITIKPPLQIVDIGNGCEAYSASIYIPAKSELTTTLQSVTQSQFFLDYNFNYTNVSNYLIWHKTNFATLTTDEIKTLKAKMLKSPTMSMDIFKKVLGNIDENYPFTMSPKLILALLVLTGVCTIVIGILFIWYKRKTSFTSTTMGNLLKLIPSLKDKIPTLDSLLPILSEQAPSQNTKNVLTNVTVPQLSQTPPDELVLPPVLVPKLQLEKPLTSVPYHTTHMEPLPSTSTDYTNYKSEPLSLEMFNRATTDLNEKGVINLKKYKKYFIKLPH